MRVGTLNYNPGIIFQRVIHPCSYIHTSMDSGSHFVTLGHNAVFKAPTVKMEKEIFKSTELSLKSNTAHSSQAMKSLKYEELPNARQDIKEKLDFHGLF